ncbi:MAG: hypothetical protein LBO09_04550 [Candidatus Peribacteria bacterium]|jgi:hypothetical protein|nr:hypothetical protein [Candidatus Peribacteria bacterium]
MKTKEFFLHVLFVFLLGVIIISLILLVSNKIEGLNGTAVIGVILIMGLVSVLGFVSTTLIINSVHWIPKIYAKIYVKLCKRSIEKERAMFWINCSSFLKIFAPRFKQNYLELIQLCEDARSSYQGVHSKKSYLLILECFRKQQLVIRDFDILEAIVLQVNVNKPEVKKQPEERVKEYHLFRKWNKKYANSSLEGAIDLVQELGLALYNQPRGSLSVEEIEKAIETIEKS